jgi:peptide/nickel transport system substrate-binding protein
MQPSGRVFDLSNLKGTAGKRIGIKSFRHQRRRTSMADPRDLEKLLTTLPMSRRTLLQRAAILVVSAPVIGSLLAACGDDDEDDEDDETDADPGDEADDEETDEDPADDEEEDTEEDDEAEEDPDEDEAEDDAEPEGEGQQGGEMVVLGHHEIESLSPDDVGPTVHWVVITNIHDGLLAVDEMYELENELASDYEISDDGLEYTFYLEEGVLFHDGEDFNAEDVVYTYEFHMDEENATILGTDFASLASVEAVDDYTVLVTLETPDASFLRRAAVTMIVPEHHHGEIGEDAYKSDAIGTGPFMVEEYSPAEYARLAAFEDHWRGRPYLDYFTEQIVPEGSVRTLQLQSGEADSIVWPPVIDDDLALLEEDALTSYVTASVSMNHFPLNNQHDILGETAVRQAMMYAIDRQQVIDDVFLGAAVIANTNIAPTLEQWYNDDVTKYEYDPEMAEQLLDEAGWEMGDDGVRERDGEPLTFICTVITGDQARLPEAETVQQFLAEVGINMEIEEAPLATIQEGQRDGSIDASLYNWTYGGTNGEPDGSATLHSEARNNWNLFQNDEVDSLLQEGLELTDEDERAEVYGEIQAIVAEEAPMLLMMYWDWHNHFTERIRGLPEGEVVSGSNLYRKAREWWIEE